MNTSLTIVMMICVLVILTNAAWKWMQVLTGRVKPVPEPHAS